MPLAYQHKRVVGDKVGGCNLLALGAFSLVFEIVVGVVTGPLGNKTGWGFSMSDGGLPDAFEQDRKSVV